MKFADWLENWGMTKLKISAPFLTMEWSPEPDDQEAAWELYIELLTRVTTQRLPLEHGEEQRALSSIYELFPLTRDILKSKGRKCREFSRISIVVLNQIVRPFTAKWHSRLAENTPLTGQAGNEFRADLYELQGELVRYARMLADMAGVEDLTQLEQSSD